MYASAYYGGIGYLGVLASFIGSAILPKTAPLSLVSEPRPLALENAPRLRAQEQNNNVVILGD